MAEAPLLLVLLPFAGALICLFVRFLPRLPLASAAAAATACGALALLALLREAVGSQTALPYSMGGWKEPLGIALYLDGLAWTSSFLIWAVVLAAVLFAAGEARYGGEFYFFLLLLAAGMQGVALTGDLFNMFVFIEILSIASFVLIAYKGEAGAQLASLRYLLLSGVSAAFFLIGVFLVYGHAGTLSLRLIAASVREGPPPALRLAAACLCVGLGLKTAFVPLHSWLPAAHAAAPHPVSAVLSGVMIKICFLAVWRLLAALEASLLQRLFLALGPLTALLGALCALSQSDAKRLLAWSSISQMGLILTAYGAGGAAGLSGALAHTLGHALFKSLLFLSVGAVIHLGGGRELKVGAGRNPQPWLVVWFSIGALSIAGLPPLVGFVSKSQLGAALGGSAALVWCLRLASAGTAASMIKLSALFGARGRDPQEPRRRLSPLCVAAMALLSAACLAGGLFPGRFTVLLLVPALGPEASLSGCTIRSVIEALLTVGAGFLMYFIARSRPGVSILGWLRTRRLSVEASLILLLMSLLGFAAAGLAV